MKFTLSALGISVLAALPVCAQADMTVGVIYNNFSQSFAGNEIDSGAAAVQLGYRYKFADTTLAVTLFGNVGVGTNTENVELFGEVVEYEVDNYYSVSLRPEHKVFDKVTVYALASYGKFKSSIRQDGESFSDTANEFGYGVGTLVNVFDDVSLNLSFEKYDQVDSLAIGLEYKF
ncbi:outer membrane beta-barrel protein [Rheinheimera fenheensis]|uniref:outer membrane beta-barrel protein n=1 Tax=Rheinheimera fenheensis TaxID=3152295 RepID=UPI00325C9AE6